MMENVRRLQAKRTRERMQFSDVRPTCKQVYDLTLAETESRDAAENAEREYIAAMLRAGLTPK
ncbi:MAG TPA: hypothetical protein PJ982_13125 [Lacipirellulaceae bacterium]|nr:hypothetical protein [Lacipirellulaceae bacterium]